MDWIRVHLNFCTISQALLTYECKTQNPRRWFSGLKTLLASIRLWVWSLLPPMFKRGSRLPSAWGPKPNNRVCDLWHRSRCMQAAQLKCASPNELHNIPSCVSTSLRPTPENTICVSPGKYPGWVYKHENQMYFLQQGREGEGVRWEGKGRRGEFFFNMDLYLNTVIYSYSLVSAIQCSNFTPTTNVIYSIPMSPVSPPCLGSHLLRWVQIIYFILLTTAYIS